ncbi:MAG: ComEC/Rec2 family competence protein, partial [Chloroflexia bacterium]
QRRRIMPFWLLILSIILIIFYTGFTGASPSVVRAAIMGAIVLLAPLVRRRYDPMSALALSAAGMVFLDPDVLLDAGFQLSFLAMWGLVVFSPPLADRLQQVGIRNVRIPGLLAYPIAVGLSAQIATLPLLVAISGQFSLVSLFATITADIALVPLMLTGIVTAILGSINFVLFTWLAWLTGLATWLSAAWLLWWVEWWSAIPWAALPIEGFQPNYAIIYYSALFAGVWLFSQSRRNDKLTKLWPNLRLSLLGATAVAVWAVAILMAFKK